MQFDVEAIKRENKLSDIIGRHVTLTKDGDEFRGLCPFHNEKTPSFTVSDPKGFYHCFGCGAHGDVLDFVADYFNVDFKGACEHLGGQRQLAAPAARSTAPAPSARDPYADLVPVELPDSIGLLPGEPVRCFNPKREHGARDWTTYRPSMVFEYRGADGAHLAYVLRIDLGAGKKITPTIRYAIPQGHTDPTWCMWPLDKPRALYGLDLLERDQDAQCLVVEGEKAADAARRLLAGTRIVVVTWVGGVNGVSHADWRPLSGRRVVIWGDADQPGEWAVLGKPSDDRHARRPGIAELAHAAGAASIKIIPWDHSLPKGFDAADAEHDGWSGTKVLAYLRARSSEWTEETPDPPETTADDTELGDPRDAEMAAAPPAEGDYTAQADEQAGDDPLALLAMRCHQDPARAFEPEVLARLAVVRKENRPYFERLRRDLKRAHVRVTALDKAITDHAGDGGRGPTQADVLLKLAEQASLFHAPDGTGYADITINEHRETWPIRSKGFRQWIAREFFRETEGAASSEALQSTLNVLEAKARFDAPERAVGVRVAGLDGKLYIDLAEAEWRAVEVGPDGWRVVNEAPVRFRRAAGMKPLPVPEPGGSIYALRNFLNLNEHGDGDFVLVVAWLLAALRDRGPYPVLALSGEQGSAKSTFASILRALVDPNVAPLRATPRDDDDLFIAATNGHVIAFDNVSSLPLWISDTLCRLATGGGFAKRELYTDRDEVLFDAQRPIILNGIEEVMSRPDLADRAIALTLPEMTERRRRPEQELWAAFHEELPRIFGALLDTMVHGLAMLPVTSLSELPRMADFALWASACEGALWPAGTFMAAYTGNRDLAVEAILDADPVGGAVRAYMAERTVRTVTSSDLLGALKNIVGEAVSRSKAWPTTPRALSGRLRRIAPALRKVGITVNFERTGHDRTRTITFSVSEREGSSSSAPSAPSAIEL